MLVLMFIAWMPAATAIAEDALEATGSKIRAWGSMSFNRPIGPDDQELSENPRSRSAKLRMARRTDTPAKPVDRAALGMPLRKGER